VRHRWLAHARRQCLLLVVAATLATAQTVSLPQGASLARMREYIKMSWDSLSRSNRDLLNALPDPKMPRKPGEPWPLYIARTESRSRVESELNGVLGVAAARRVAIRTLPSDANAIRDHGLLYLPRPYVVPGGRFNEMYGWDSYFIQVGLLRDGELALARDMTDNLLYQIRHAVEGLRRYGFDADADRLATKFLALLAKEFDEHGTIVEKYDGRRRESDVAAGIRFGYSANQGGFGWTNGVALELLAGLRRRTPSVRASDSGTRSQRRSQLDAASLRVESRQFVRPC